jgi:hypothetical protein
MEHILIDSTVLGYLRISDVFAPTSQSPSTSSAMLRRHLRLPTRILLYQSRISSARRHLPSGNTLIRQMASCFLQNRKSILMWPPAAAASDITSAGVSMAMALVLKRTIRRLTLHRRDDADASLLLPMETFDRCASNSMTRLKQHFQDVSPYFASCARR